jgi:VWFA-related protein
MRICVRVVFVLAVILGCSFSEAGAAGHMTAPAALHVRILAPAEGALVVGPTQLQAGVEPADVVSSVVFFVDGSRVCTVAAPPFECEWDAGTTIAQHQVRLVVNLVAGGRVVRTSRTWGAPFAETVDVDVVKVTVTVTNDRGQYVKGLPRSAFHVSEDGRPQPITHFFAEDAPLELVVAVDMSSSMRSAVSRLKEAVSNFLSAVPTRHGVTLLGFNNDVFTLARRSVDPAERVKAVDGLTAWGSTVLYDVILQGADLLDSRTGRKALVVFTDGDDSGSFATIAEVEERLQASDLTLYMIGQGQGLRSAPLRKVMERMAQTTGGRAFFTEHADDLRDVFNTLLEELSEQYALGYQSPNGTRDGTWQQITVDVEGHRRVRARQGYRAAPPSSQRR